MRTLHLELLDGSEILNVTPAIASEFLSDHGRFIARNGGIDTDLGFVFAHAVKRVRFYEPLAPSQVAIVQGDDKLVADAIENADGWREVYDEIQNATVFDDQRAEMIARTETAIRARAASLSFPKREKSKKEK